MKKNRDNLDTSVENLYHVFQRYLKLSEELISGDPKLCQKKLRQLTANDLWDFLFSALDGQEDIDDLRHFLPRMLELSVIELGTNEIWSVNSLFEKISWAKWKDWTVTEKASIEAFILAWWEHTLTDFPAVRRLSELLKAISFIHNDLSPYLDKMTFATNAEAYQHFNDSIEFFENPKKFLSKAHASQVSEWLTKSTTLTWLDQGLIAHSSESWSIELATNVDRIRLSSR